MDELMTLTKQLPVQLWNSAIAAQVYRHTLNVVCFSRQDRPIGVWVCPLDRQGGTDVRRAFRLLPYASPWVDSALHPTVRHKVVASMASTLMSRVDSIELPMDPNFGEVASLLETGIEALCRHTRVLDIRADRDIREGYLPTVRSTIRAAEKYCAAEDIAPETFAFARAIVGQPEAAIAARCRSALAISRRVPTLCLAAVDDQKVCRGQAFVVRSDNAAVLMHLWFERTGPRGVPSLLVDQVISRAAVEMNVDILDFEGSVIPSIDQFMAGFGAHALTYPHVRWHRSSGSVLAEFG
ncbi:hypothetical protein [Nocardia gipuzkoensis]